MKKIRTIEIDLHALMKGKEQEVYKYKPEYRLAPILCCGKCPYKGRFKKLNYTWDVCTLQGKSKLSTMDMVTRVNEGCPLPKAKYEIVKEVVEHE